MKKKDRYIVIMAGGRGERFWPVSRESNPKQLISLLSDRSFMQQTVDRVKTLVPLENIIVITNAIQLSKVRKQLPDLPRKNIIGEPCGRDTCAAVALSAAIVRSRSENGVMAVLPADHFIASETEFRRVLLDSMYFAKSEMALITIGIKAEEPSTGYGYIQVGKRIRRDISRSLKSTFFNVKRFVEKPNLSKAKGYLKSGNYRWNAGMFIWSCAAISEELKRQQPKLYLAVERWSSISSLSKLNSVLSADYPKLNKISVDYAIMENAKSIVCADGKFGWDDLGSWPALSRHIKSDKNGNCSVANVVQVDSSNNIIFDARSDNSAPIALVGINDAIVVQSDDATMIAAKSESQKIKQLVLKLCKDKRFKHLV